MNHLTSLFYNLVKSPFKRRTPSSKKEDPKQEDEKSPQLKVFAADCSLRFDKMKLRKENQIQNEGTFVKIFYIDLIIPYQSFEIYLKEEEESIRSVIREAENLAILIEAEELISKQIDEPPQTELHTDGYLDNNYFWKTYNIDVDLSEL